VRRIAEQVVAELTAAGVQADLLSTIVPPGYVADAFVSIHADGNRDTSVRGFKIAPPRRDYSGRATALVDALYASYGATTGIPTDSAITNRMTAYYAFNWSRYEHAIHPRTPAAIVETGFLTNPTDRRYLTESSVAVASGITSGILAFLAQTETPRPTPLPLVQPTLPITGTLVCAPLRAERLARGQQAESCTPAVMHESGYPVVLSLQEDDVRVSALTNRVGETITVTGTYVPVQALDNYFWFRYEVLGLLQDPLVVTE
jgi:hypothetical protein